MNHTFRTSPPPTYLEPTQEEMREMAKKVGLKSFSRDLVADLTNLAAGGQVNPPSEYRSQVQSRVEESLPAPDSDGDWTIPKSVRPLFGGNQYTKSRTEAAVAQTEAKMRYHQNVCDFLQTVDLSRFPGGTPLEQAMSMLKLLSEQEGGSGGGEGGEPLPIFQDNDRPEDVAENLHETMDVVDSLTDEELDMVDPEGDAHDTMDDDVEDSPEGDGERSGGQALDRLKVAQDIAEGSDKRTMLEISRTLDQITKLQVRRQKLVDPDPAGDEVRTRPIRHLGELSRVTKPSWGLYQQNRTYFMYKAVTGQLGVRERVTRIEKKQAIFILCDGSGSMRGKKHFKATGVVMNRLKAVLDGDAEVWLSVFDTSLDNARHASTPEEARELIKSFAAQNFRGGGTDIAAAVRAAHAQIQKMIESGEALYRPEIVVLTDEDTSIKGLKKPEVEGTRVHGFAMEVSNKPLVEFAKSTGGVGLDNF